MFGVDVGVVLTPFIIDGRLCGSVNHYLAFSVVSNNTLRIVSTKNSLECGKVFAEQIINKFWFNRGVCLWTHFLLQECFFFQFFNFICPKKSLGYLNVLRMFDRQLLKNAIFEDLNIGTQLKFYKLIVGSFNTFITYTRGLRYYAGWLIKVSFWGIYWKCEEYI